MSESALPSAGRILDGRYALAQTPRRGGMAVVYQAFDTHGVFSQVAVKVLPGGQAQHDRYLTKSFEREQRSLERLRHENIVELLDGGRDRDSGERYLVFPWMDHDLAAELDRSPVAGWDDYWHRYGEPILKALSFAFEQGVVHRDLKPSNVMIDADGRPRVCDFGIAKILSQVAPELTLADHRSPPFCPPEADDGLHTPTRDVYAFGALAAFAVTGSDPYDARLPEPHDRLRAAVDALDVPIEVEAVIRRCVDVDPARRQADTVVLASELNQLSEARKLVQNRSLGRPLISLKLGRKVRDAIEIDRDVHSADVDDIVLGNLEAEFGILPYAGGGPDRSDQYLIVGTEMSLHVMVEPVNRDRLVVLKALSLPSSRLERDRERGWSGPLQFVLESPLDQVTAEDAIAGLEQSVAEHAAERLRQRRLRARKRPVTVWRRTLGALRAIERGREDPLPYHDVRRTARGYTFSLVRPPSQSPVGEVRLAPADGDQDFVGDVRGINGHRITLRPRPGSARDVSPTGELRVDTRAAIAAIRRQEVALDAVEYGRALRGDLRDLLLDPTTVREPVPVEPMRWRQEVDEPKQRAVAAALGAEDLLLVEGPPGTGKTRFIAELVVQYLARHPRARILISSQTHAALDNALERLAVLDKDLRLLRIARSDDERVSEEASALTVDQHLARWRQDAEASGNDWLRTWAEEAGLSERNVEIAMRSREVAAELQRLRTLPEQLRDVEARLREARTATKAAASSATSPDIVSDLAAAADQLREAIRSAEVDAAIATERLVALRELPKGTRARDLDPAELRARADALLPAATPEAARCQELIELLAEWHSKFGRGAEFAAAALVRSQVVAATCVGLGGVPGLDNVEFDLCLIDEASKATATELFIPMARSRRTVLVGDDKQLPPYLDDALRQPRTLADHDLTEEDVRRPLFSRLARELPSACRVPLSLQHRMVPEIGDLVSECFYGGDLDSVRRKGTRVLDILAPRPVTWLTTAGFAERYERRLGTSIANDVEAECCRVFLETANSLAAAARKKLHVAVLTGYLGQRELLDQQLRGERSQWKWLQIDCATVDSFQGREADVVVYSVTRSNAKGVFGFIRERPRMNVALSRARDVLVIVGDHTCARTARGDNPLGEVVEYIEDHPSDCILQEARR